MDDQDMNDITLFNTALLNSIIPYISFLLPYIVTIPISILIIYKNMHLLLTKFWNLFISQHQMYEICFTIGGIIAFTYISSIIVDIYQQLDKKFEILDNEKTELLNKIKIFQDENNELKTIIKKFANIYEIEAKKYK